MSQSSDFHTVIGASLLEWRDGLARVSMDVQPIHLNRAGILHGGMLLTLLDEVATLSGIWCSVKGNRRFALTVELSGRFTGQVKSGQLVATGECVTHGRSLFFARSEVRDAAGQIIGYGASTHKWRRGSESVEGVAVA